MEGIGPGEDLFCGQIGLLQPKRYGAPPTQELR